jgi:hypothetical protein
MRHMRASRKLSPGATERRRERATLGLRNWSVNTNDERKAQLRCEKKEEKE